MARVLVVQVGDVHAALQFVRVLHVPVGHEFHAIRIRVHQQDDAIVAEAGRLFVVETCELPQVFNQLLCAEYFGGVQAAVNPHNGFAFFRQFFCFDRINTFGERKLARNFFVSREILHVFGARDNRHDLRLAEFRVANRIEFDAIGCVLRDLCKVLMKLGVVRQLVIGADVVPKEFLGRGDFTLGLQEAGGGREGRDGQRSGQNSAQIHAWGTGVWGRGRPTSRPPNNEGGGGDVGRFSGDQSTVNDSLKSGLSLRWNYLAAGPAV